MEYHVFVMNPAAVASIRPWKKNVRTNRRAGSEELVRDPPSGTLQFCLEPPAGAPKTNTRVQRCWIRGVMGKNPTRTISRTMWNASDAEGSGTPNDHGDLCGVMKVTPGSMPPRPSWAAVCEDEGEACG